MDLQRGAGTKPKDLALMSKKKILMVTGTFLPEINGAVLQCVQIIERLGNEFDFEVLTGAKLPVFEGTFCKVPVHRLVSNASIKNAIQSIFNIGTLLLASRFDIIHFHGYSKKTLIIGAFGLLLGSKIILKCTSFGKDDAQSILLRGWAHKIMARAIDAWICPIPAFEHSCATARVSTSRIHAISNMVDTERFLPVPIEEKRRSREELGLCRKAGIVLFVGHFSQEKRPHLLLESMETIMRKDKKVFLIFVGTQSGPAFEVDPTIAPRMKKRAVELGIHEQIIWIPRHDSIEEIYNVADIFVMPSVREGMPNALLEAMASGLCVVATMLPGITDCIIPGNNTNSLVSPDRPEQLREKIEFFLNNPKRRADSSKMARAQVVDRFSPGMVCNQLRNLYANLKNG